MLEGRPELSRIKASRPQGWRLQGATSNTEDHRLPGRRGLPFACKRDNGIQPGVKGCELVDCDGLPPLCHCRHACILTHVTCIGPTSPGSGSKECDESSMHTYVLFAAFQVTFVSHYFLVGNVVGATLQITWLYNSGMERFKNEEDWPHMRPAFTYSL